MVITTADVKWIKIVTDIFDDDKILLIESMPDADAIIVIWFKLLCLAGKQNNSGVFLLNGRIAYTDEMFATIFRRPLNTVRMALRIFEQFGMIEIINDTVTIPNWEKHQKLDALEASREATRNRVALYREKQKMLADSSNVTCNVTVTDGNGDRIDKSREDKSRGDKKREELLARFSRFWSVYPNKVKKNVAESAWIKLAPDDALTDRIVADVELRLRTEWKGQDKNYIPHPTTYLHQRRWEDETPPTERRNTAKEQQPVTERVYEDVTEENFDKYW